MISQRHARIKRIRLLILPWTALQPPVLHTIVQTSPPTDPIRRQRVDVCYVLACFDLRLVGFAGDGVLGAVECDGAPCEAAGSRFHESRVSIIVVIRVAEVVAAVIVIVFLLLPCRDPVVPATILPC